MPTPPTSVQNFLSAPQLLTGRSEIDNASPISTSPTTDQTTLSAPHLLTGQTGSAHASTMPAPSTTASCKPSLNLAPTSKNSTPAVESRNQPINRAESSFIGRLPPNIRDAAAQLHTAINNAESNRKIPIHLFYPEFAGCTTLPLIISRATYLAPYEFDVDKALDACSQNPRHLDTTMLANDTAFAVEHGISALLEHVRTAVATHTLQHDVVLEKHQDASTFKQLADIALNGVNTTTFSDFIPNNDPTMCPTYPREISHPKVIMHLLCKGLKLRRYILLPLPVALRLAKEAHLDIHFSPPFIVRKRGSHVGRLVINYSFAGPNDPRKKDFLRALHGAIKTPQYANICSLLENAAAVFPNQPIFALRRDIDAAYNRIKYNDKSSLLTAFKVENYACIPIVGQMGDQDINTQFDQITIAVKEALAKFIKSATGSDKPLSDVATDDIIAFGNKALADSSFDFIGALVGDYDRRGLLGQSAIGIDKDLMGQIIEILGWCVNCQNRTIRPNALTLAKLIHSFFVIFSPDPQPGQSIKLRDMQRIAAHAVRSADVITAMLPYSRSFHHATRGYDDPDRPVYLTKRCIHDIAMWRTLLITAMADSAILECPTFAPPLRQRAFPSEPSLEREKRAEMHADIVAYSDASLEATGAPCIGGVVPGIAWFNCELPLATSLALKDGSSRDTDINIFEFTALVVTANLAIEALKLTRTDIRHSHIHILCDNTSSVWRTRNQRAQHPIYSLLLSTFSLIQIKTGVLITCGYIEGYKNFLADAASRKFKVLNGQLYRDQLEPLQRYKVGQTFLNAINRSLNTSSDFDTPVVLTGLIEPVKTTSSVF